ncbi:NTP transferase domain-containing protein [Mariprofundus sp. NF]|nr:glycosyltransferase family protein [Mariprofundus sp. NF]NWF37922.1 NTP transferase domain-containing protein [Mariprofundus sp. NF]
MILAILQARLSSTRLPNKVLLPLFGKPMLVRQIERVMRSNRIDQLVVATSDGASDDAIETLCDSLNISCFRGSLDDVLDRFYQATVMQGPDHVVRLTGDCPLADPDVIDGVIQMHLLNQNDYTSNCIHPTFPDGLDVEVIRYEALKEAWSNAELKSQREHVTPYIYQHPERFKISNYYHSGENLSHLRWTVDEARDFELVTEIYQRLYPEKPEFNMHDVLELLEEHPVLKAINTHIERNEGYQKSLLDDGVEHKKEM